jgi:HEAT repeat protein
VRAVAATALGATGDPRALEPLMHALTEADGDVRQVVAEAIGRLRDHNAIESLILAQLDPDSRVRQTTLASLIKINPEWARTESAQKTLPALKRGLKHPDYGVRQTAADLLNRIFNIRQCEPTLVADVDAETIRRQRAVDVLASILWDDDSIVRFAGVWALRQIGDARAAGPLSTKLNDHEEFVRREAEQTLAQLGMNEPARSARGRELQTSDSWGNGPIA